jgi:hypothetical protein
MKCQHCSREVKLWQTSCPHCKGRLPNNSFSTMVEIPVTVEQQSRRRLLRQTLQFGLLALTIIILAGVVRLSPPQANPLSKDTLKVAAATTPGPTPQPEVVATSVAPTPSADSAPKTTEAKLQSIDLFADVLALSSSGKASIPKPRATSVEGKKAEPILPVIDEVPPKKVTNPVLVPSPAAPNASASLTPEAEPNLELDGAQTLLQPNIGLVTIKSYVPARVYIDGVYSGMTPRSVKLLAGEHSISLMAAGYHDYTRTVKISGQQQLGILAAMSKK